MDVGLAIGFWVLAIITVVSALLVVTVRNVFHAALFLVVSFIGVAGIYITLSADFVAAVQVLLYAGAISVLLIFAIMMTRDTMHGNLASQWRVPAVFVSVLTLVTVGTIVVNANWPLSNVAPPQQTTEVIADALFNKFVLPFEIASVLLLVAMVGAMVLANKER